MIHITTKPRIELIKFRGYIDHKLIMHKSVKSSRVCYAKMITHKRNLNMFFEHTHSDFQLLLIFPTVLMYHFMKRLVNLVTKNGISGMLSMGCNSHRLAKGGYYMNLLI